jgi:hypothetical protein
VTRSGDLPITVLRLSDRKSWAQKVRSAVRTAKGDLRTAALALGCGRMTLYRWLDEDDFVDDKLPRRPPGRPESPPKAP